MRPNTIIKIERFSYSCCIKAQNTSKAKHNRYIHVSTLWVSSGEWSL